MASLFRNPFRTRSAPRQVGWETRYEGNVAVAVIDGVPVAGISGPWPDGHFALTWWSSHDSDVPPTLEFHTSMDAARHRVEEVTENMLLSAA